MKLTTRKSSTTPVLDPLYVIFEEHLYNIQDPDSDRKTFLFNIVQEYITFLRRQNIVVPKSLELPIIEELMNQVNTMLIKRIYGTYSIDEFQRTATPQVKKKARSRYKRIATAAAGSTATGASAARSHRTAAASKMGSTREKKSIRLKAVRPPAATAGRAKKKALKAA